MPSKKEEALNLIHDLRGTVEYALPNANPSDLVPDIIDRLDDLKKLVQAMGECNCHE